MAQEPESAPTTKRTCGSCTMCCKVFAVTELEKEGGVWCPHCLPGEGCSIYEQRPRSCRGFACLWLQGSLADSDRPDRLGAVFWSAGDNLRHHPDGSSTPYVILSEQYDGSALSDRRTRDIVTDLVRRNTPVAICRGTTFKILGLEHGKLVVVRETQVQTRVAMTVEGQPGA